MWFASAYTEYFPTTAVHVEVHNHGVVATYVAPVARAAAFSVCSWSVNTASLAGVEHACTSVSWAARQSGPACARYGISPHTTFLVPGEVIEVIACSRPACHCAGVGA